MQETEAMGIRFPESGRPPGGEHGNLPQYGESHEQRSLAGYSPQGHKESAEAI